IASFCPSFVGRTLAIPEGVSGGHVNGYPLAVRPDWALPHATSAATAETAVLSDAGASRTRDAVDLRVIATMLDGTGRIIDSQDEVGGWPDLVAGTPWSDSDGDGMPDDWERAQGHDPTQPDGASDRNGDGYTNLEDWLNSLAS
ncbi:MAG: hypothetical protein K2X61_01555, partial [Caulobacteraceae bacterium]|nr:hypothetical protein [Caulobacteraceae bacterium]